MATKYLYYKYNGYTCNIKLAESKSKVESSGYDGIQGYIGLKLVDYPRYMPYGKDNLYPSKLWYNKGGVNYNIYQTVYDKCMYWTNMNERDGIIFVQCGSTGRFGCHYVSPFRCVTALDKESNVKLAGTDNIIPKSYSVVSSRVETKTIDLGQDLLMFYTNYVSSYTCDYIEWWWGRCSGYNTDLNVTVSNSGSYSNRCIIIGRCYSGGGKLNVCSFYCAYDYQDSTNNPAKSCRAECYVARY